MKRIGILVGCFVAILNLGCEPTKQKSVVPLSINRKDVANKETLYKELCSAVESNQIDKVTKLLARGVDPNSSGSESNNWTLLDIALDNGRADIAEILAKYGGRISKSENPCILPIETFSAVGNTNIIRILLDQGVDPNACRHSGIPVFLAAANGHIDTVKYLISRGANFRTNNWDGGTLLHAAAQGGNSNLVECLLTKDMVLDARNGNGETPLFVAAKYGRLDVARCLIAKGAILDVKTIDDGQTILFAAAQGGCKELVDALLAKGMDFRVVTSRNCSMLHAAAEGNCREFVDFLLSKGADVNARNGEGETPLHLAVSRGNKEVVEMLVDRGAAINIMSGYFQRSPLYQAVAARQTNIVQYLLDKGADVNAGGSYGVMKPLYSAVQGGDKGIVQILLNHGADSGNSLLHSPESMCYGEIYEMLIAHGADMNARNERGWTPLHSALIFGQIGIVELLISKGADVNAETVDGDTPLSLAKLSRHAKIVETLRKHGALEGKRKVPGEIRTSAIPIDRVRDADWMAEKTSKRVERVTLLLTNGSPLTVSLEYGEMDCVSHEWKAKFVSHTNRLTFALCQMRRFGFEISVSKPAHVYTFVTHPRLMGKDGKFSTSYMFPSESLNGSQYYFFDLTRDEWAAPGTYEFSIHLNGCTVRTLRFETGMPGYKAPAQSVETSDMDPVAIGGRMSCRELVECVQKRLPENVNVRVSSERPGQLTLSRRNDPDNRTPEFTDLSCLRGLDIDDLNLNYMMKLTDLTPLSGLPLRSVNLSMLGVMDLAPLSGMPLTNLKLWLMISDISPLTNMPLQSLDLGDAHLQDLSALRGMSITKLGINLNDIANTDLSLITSLPLTNLYVRSDSKEYSIACLSKMKKLTRLCMRGVTPVDLSVLKSLPVTDLGIFVEELSDISAVRGLHLTDFWVYGKNLTDLSPLEGMPLRVVRLSQTKVQDLTPLKGCPIEELNISETRVTDISALRGMPLRFLDMSRTKVEDFTPLEGMSLEQLKLGDLSAVKKGIDVVRSMKSLRYLSATVSVGHGYMVLEDSASVFWNKYDAYFGESGSRRTDY